MYTYFLQKDNWLLFVEPVESLPSLVIVSYIPLTFIDAIFNSAITYLLLTEFEVRTVSYGPSFFPLIYGPSAKHVGHKSTGKNEDP